ncbi:13647_t:CDS:2 [Funneliformis geosporum]|uniref:Phospholipid-transporting ATPase n=1 Tax=Funneliformis geosporum TaxID=1117311 RepID=A0A9W4X112_9GLOM|nr:13647_t:CDS:2 [Funneliformis geosporum]CAI2178530.1 16960_t:CDS:2 [Funneliformis geosporum]
MVQDHDISLTLHNDAHTNLRSSSLEEIERLSNDLNTLDRITSQFDNNAVETLQCQDFAEEKYLEYLGKRTSDKISNCSLSSNNPNKPSNITKLSMNSLDQVNEKNSQNFIKWIFHILKRQLRTLIYGHCSETSFREIPIIPERKEPLLDPRTNKPFIKNAITTSRYTFYDFFPKQLYAQFSKVANVYFLFVAAIQAIPGWSPTGQFTTLIPLSTFMSISMAREGFDDIRRHKQDKDENNKECLVLHVYRSNDAASQRMSLWIKTKWKNLRVGDIVSIKAQEWIPADLFLLHSEGEEGICYIETAALDGETNLKQRQALKEVNYLLTSPEALANFSGNVKTENPNQDLYNFEGSIEFDGKTSQLTNNQILLRGTILRNTPEIYGLVTYTGEETKLRMNATKNIRTKAPNIQRLINRVVIIIFCFVLFLATINTILAKTWLNNSKNHTLYLGKYSKNYVTIFFAFIILFNTMIPISLYVTMEFVKLAQVYFINNDLDMYHEETNTPAEAHTCTINEELGQVNYLFSDKTGTLTDNIMLFRKLSVGGRSFLHDLNTRRINEDDLLSKFQKPRKQVTLSSVASLYNRHKQSGHISGENNEGRNIQIDTLLCRKNSAASTFSMIAPRSPDSSRSRCSSLNSQKLLSNKSIPSTLDLLTIIRHQFNTPFGERARFFLLAMALCHTCVPEVIGLDSQEICYQSASPDEFAIVTAAKELGYIVSDRTLGVVSLRIIDDDEPDEVPDKNCIAYEDHHILNVLEFSSKRKRMSIIYQLPDGRICLLCKGADNVILERLRHPRNKPTNKKLFVESTNRDHVIDLFPIRNDKWLYSKTIRDIQEFSTEGLRTLLYGHRFINQDEYAVWSKLYQEASVSLVDRQQKLEEIAELIERDLEITGATAIEDKLQNGVPEAIDKLRKAGIKIWMLTGDKRETAINIGYSCSLIKEYSTTIIVDSNLDLKKTLQSTLKDIHKSKISHSVTIVDGNTLMIIEQNPELMDLFLKLGVLCEAVICCRVSPSQKALVVRKIREKLTDAVTLAIGDGANDIAMIQEAHVGIGITGREGLQAARSSDYSIAQFRFLTTLLFIHGRWSYIRVSKFVLGTFYKCMCFYLTQGIFQFFTGFSGTSLYEHWTLAAYNTLFSSLPVMVIGIFEQDLNRKTLIGVPELYRTMGQLNSAFNLKIFFSWMCAGIYHAFVIVLMPFFLHETFIHYEVKAVGSPQLYELGLIAYTCVVFVVTLKVAYLECHNCTYVTHLTSFLTLFGWFLYQTIYSYLYPEETKTDAYDVKGVFQQIGIRWDYWFTILITSSLALIPNYLVKVVKSVVLPCDVDIYQRIEKDEKLIDHIIEEGREIKGNLTVGRAVNIGIGGDKIETEKNDVEIIESIDVGFDSIFYNNDSNHIGQDMKENDNPNITEHQELSFSSQRQSQEAETSSNNI